MSGSADVTIYQSKPGDTDQKKDAFIINDELEEVDIFDILTTHYKLQSTNLDINSEIPIYDILNEYLASKRPEVGLTDCIIIYYKLQEELYEDIEKISISNEVNQKYVETVIDISEEYDIEIIDRSDTAKRDTKTPFFRLGKSLLLVFLAFVRSLLYSSLSSTRSSTKSRTIFIPMPNRTYHFKSLLYSISDYEVFTTHPKETGLSHESQLYTQLSLWGLTQTFLKWIRIHLFTYRKVQIELIDRIEEKFEVRLPKTVRYTVEGCITFSNSHSLWKYLIYRRVFDDEEIDTIVVGGLTMDCKAALLASVHADKNTYYLPHSITYPFHPTPPTDSTFFTPESINNTYWNHRIEHSNLKEDNLIETGRVDLQDSFESVDERTQQSNKTLELLLATQPHADEMREQFVNSILEAVNGSSRDIEVRIKIHPGEDAEFYAEYAVSEVLEDGLTEAIDSADIVCTVNSNVGVISMSRKTPVVSINLWSPRISPPIYALDGDIPMLERNSEVEKFFCDLTRKKVNQLMKDQHTYFKKSYYFPNCISTIKRELSLH